MQSRAQIAAHMRVDRHDLIVIGGGANGAGIALDAASRGLRVALFEKADYGSGTSSRSSKLIHGGVRYLGLGQWGLVGEALAEQALLLKNAPTIVRPRRFVIPAYSYFDVAKFRIGLKLYDWLAADRGLKASDFVTSAVAKVSMPTLRSQSLRGAIAYDDAAFDDCRLLLCVLAKAREFGALTLNYAEVVDILTGANGSTKGVVIRDHISGEECEILGQAVINAAGPSGDAVRTLDERSAGPSLNPSQGAHVVVGSRFLPGDQALVLPRTTDGRIMFALPWHGNVLLGTTDTPMRTIPPEPRPLAAEIESILAVAADFLDPAPGKADVLSVFAGLRPLVGIADGSATAKRSREHALSVSRSGMITVSGGKWTTYRLIAQQTVDLAIRTSALQAPPSTTQHLALTSQLDGESQFSAWGNGGAELAAIVRADPRLGQLLHPELPYCAAHYIWAARAEHALFVSDALAFHTRAMFINARAARTIAPQVAEIMAQELRRDAQWIAQELAAVARAAERFSCPLDG